MLICYWGKQEAARIWCLERVRHSPYAITAFVQWISHKVVVHIHTEVSVCVMSWVEVGDHPGGNPKRPQHCKSRGSLRPWVTVETIPWGTPVLPTTPAKACHTQSTCIERPSKDPALAKSDWPEARSLPLLEDLHTAVPVPGVPAICVAATPIPSKHTVVIIAIDLGRKNPKKISTESDMQSLGNKVGRRGRKPESHCVHFLCLSRW